MSLNSSQNPKDIVYIGKLLHQNINIPIAIWRNNELVKEFNSFFRKHPLYDIKMIYQNLIGQKVVDSNKPSIKSINDIEFYLHLKFDTGEIENFHYLIGPVLLNPLEEHQFHNLIKENKVPFRLKEVLKSYFDSLPVYSLNKMKNLGQLIYYILTQDPIDSEEISIAKSITKDSSSYKDSAEFQMTLRRSQEKLHHDNSHENKLRQLVKEGRYEEIKQLSLSSPSPQNFGTVASHPIRNEKNLAITAVALASRAAMEGGLNPEVAYSLSDGFIQKIESDDQFYNFLPYTFDIFYEYAYRVAEIKNNNYTKPIQDVQHYIYNNLYKKLDLNILADHVYLNPNYLSRLFKSEVGLSISEYILREKVKESKNWLRNSNLPISEISSQVNFYDQSHFSRVFKRIVGITPNQYRKKHR